MINTRKKILKHPGMSFLGLSWFFLLVSSQFFLKPCYCPFPLVSSQSFLKPCSCPFPPPSWLQSLPVCPQTHQTYPQTSASPRQTSASPRQTQSIVLVSLPVH